MNRYIGYIGRAMLALGIIMLVFGIICMCSAGNGIGRLEDVYYYMDMNLFHGRFDSGDAGNVLEMLDDIGISGAVISGFERFALGARYPFVILGLFVIVAGAVLSFGTGIRIQIPENTLSAAFGIWKKVCIFWTAAVEWVRMKLSGHRCPVCGEKLIKGAVFCGNCGAVIEPEKADGE